MLRHAFIIFTLFFSLSLSARKIHLAATAKPLNQVLIEMRDKYSLKFSFDDKLLSQYKVEINRKFSSPSKALDYLLRQFALSYQMQAGVYVIYPSMAVASDKTSVYPKNECRISGTVCDRTSGESLPYASILINGYGMACDETGRFNFVSRSDTTFSLRISHLGYYVQDTVVVNPGTKYNFRLEPATYKIKEVVVSRKVEKNLRTTELPGVLRANNLIANNLPGSGNASVFNFLRLMPGFLAAGEQSQDLVIWGCYEGQSQLSVDGYTLFGLKNFNDNISSVNPYMVKDIKLLKGGYGAQYGGRIGGMVDVTGIDGNIYKPELKVNLNNLTVNALASTPIGKQSSLTAAFRQTFYNLYNMEKLNPFRRDDHTTRIENQNAANTSNVPTQPNNNSNQPFPNNVRSALSSGLSKASQPQTPTELQSQSSAIYLYPDYDFRDANLKYSGKSSQGDSYFISLYGGMDRFNYSLDDSLANSPFTMQANQKNMQWGASSAYNKLWGNGNRSAFNIAYSSLKTTAVNNNALASPSPVTTQSDRANRIQEVKALVDNYSTINSIHFLTWGGGLVSNAYRFTEKYSSQTASDLKNDVQLLQAYASDQINLSRAFTFNPGLRLDYSFLEHKAYWQPRLSARMELGETFKMAVSWGKYNQFVSKNYIVDSNRGTYNSAWTVCDGDKIPVSSSTHWVSGIYYNKKGFSASLEGYYKTLDGLSRVSRSQGRNGQSVSTYDNSGTGRSAGLDFLVKQQYRRHYAWVSYSLSKTEELFSSFTNYRPAPQDQRHEFKSALILDFTRLVFSTNYVYGSGFPVYERNMTVISSNRQSYNRWDASLSYRFSPRHFNMQTGISVLNILDSDNLKLSELVQNPSDVNNVLTIYSRSIPFTPMLFLEISF